MDVSDYCREIETHLCRKNEGHLIRIVGPSFEVVSRWATDGVPLKVAMTGMDRYFERYYRKGPRRRPVKVDFCEADVRDAFDEWRRATGITAGRASAAAPDASGADAATARKRGPSLPEHLERVLIRLSSLRATGALGESADPLVDRVSAELDAARARPAGVRGDERRATLDRLAALDAELMTLASRTAPEALVRGVRAEALDELASFRATMASDAFAQAVSRAATRVLRDRLGLPQIALN